MKKIRLILLVLTGALASCEGDKTNNEIIDSEENIEIVTTLNIIPSSKTIDEGVSFQFDLLYSPDSVDLPIVKWRSSDTSSVIVDESGLIIGKKAGSATITASIYDDKVLSMADVVVNEVQELYLEENSKILFVGETVQIEAISDFSISYDIVDPTSTYSIEVSETGLVTANKVGAGVVVVESNGVQLNFGVVIMPKNYLFTEPNICWGSSKEEALDSMGWKEADVILTDNGFVKEHYSNNIDFAGFLFENNIISTYFVGVREEDFDEAFIFLNERYYLASYTDDMYFFVDGISEESRTTSISLFRNITITTLNSNRYRAYALMYMPLNQNKSLTVKSIKNLSTDVFKSENIKHDQ